MSGRCDVIGSLSLRLWALALTSSLYANRQAISLIESNPGLAGEQVPGEGLSVLSYLAHFEGGIVTDEGWGRLAGAVQPGELLEKHYKGFTFLHILVWQGYIKPEKMKLFVLKAGKEGLAIQNVSYELCFRELYLLIMF